MPPLSLRPRLYTWPFYSTSGQSHTQIVYNKNVILCINVCTPKCRYAIGLIKNILTYLLNVSGMATICIQQCNGNTNATALRPCITLPKNFFAGQQEKNRLQAAMWRLILLRYLPEDSPSVEHLCHTADSRLFSAVLRNPGHVLHGLLSPPPQKKKTRSPSPSSRDYMTILFHKWTISHTDRL